MKGLSSTALAEHHQLAGGRCSRGRRSARRVCLTMPAIFSAASMLMPARVEPTLTLEHTRSVAASALGMESISLLSAADAPLCTSAEKPPTKSTPTSAPALVHGHGDARRGRCRGTAAQISAMGVTEMRLFTIGMPNSRSSCSAVGTSCSAAFVMLVVHLARHGVDIRVRAGAQVQAQRDGADVQVLLADHGKRFGDFFRGDLHDAVLLTGDSFATG